jgi:hypothetical protein
MCHEAFSPTDKIANQARNTTSAPGLTGSIFQITHHYKVTKAPHSSDTDNDSKKDPSFLTTGNLPKDGLDHDLRPLAILCVAENEGRGRTPLYNERDRCQQMELLRGKWRR